LFYPFLCLTLLFTPLTALTSKQKTTSIASSHSLPAIPIKANASLSKQKPSLAVLLTSVPQGQGDINTQSTNQNK
jgi:hypothetical protein